MNKTIVTEETEDDSNGESQDTLEDSIVDRMTKPIETQVAPEKQFIKISDWLEHFNTNFISTIISNMDPSTNDQTGKAVQKKVKMTPPQVSAVLRSLGHHTSQFIGASKPDKALCRCLVKLLAKHLPETIRGSERLATNVSNMFRDLNQK